MSVLLFFLIFYILLGFSLMKPFEKAGVPAIKAWIPGVAAMEWAKIIGRKPSFALWLLFPIVNIFIFAGMCVDLMRSFGRHSFLDAALSVIYAPLAFFGIGRDPKATYEGPILVKENAFRAEYAAAEKSGDKATLRRLDKENPFKKGQIREWTEAIVFAVFAAAFIRMFLIEAYVIPTSSMEGTMKVGDFLFVSKVNYGIRTPMTVVQFPLVHNHFSPNGLFDRESYLTKPSLPYYRLPALESIDRNDPIVFNYPEGDSIVIMPERTFSIHDFRRYGAERELKSRTFIPRPIDKRDHYIKRCIGLPGDSLQIINRQVYINGKPAPNPKNMQFSYHISGSFNEKKLDELGVSIRDHRDFNNKIYNLDSTMVQQIQGFGGDVRLEVVPNAPTNRPMLFPHDEAHIDYTLDDFGPIYIPKAGVTTPLTAENINFYARIITAYEGNTLETKGDQFLINGQPASTYTFKQDYYWAMGDNRHNSEDSRFWGYVPADHIVGKPLFIWFSLKNGRMADGIRWNRIFTSAQK